MYMLGRGTDVIIRNYITNSNTKYRHRWCLCRLMFSNNFLSEGMGDLAANMFNFTTVFKQVHELISLLV